MSKRRFILAIAAALIAGGMLAASLRLPLWHMRMEAPQYQDGEALKVFVFPGSLQGDLNEIKVLNKYIGVTVPTTLPQTNWLPLTLSIIAALGVVAAFLPLRIRRWVAFAVAASLCAAILTAAAQAQVQMYHIGHDRNPHAALKGIPDFTPPLLGNRKLAQFELKSRLGAGSFAIAGAVVFYAAMGFVSREKSIKIRRTENESFIAPAQPVLDYAI